MRHHAAADVTRTVTVLPNTAPIVLIGFARCGDGQVAARRHAIIAWSVTTEFIDPETGRPHVEPMSFQPEPIVPSLLTLPSVYCLEQKLDAVAYVFNEYRTYATLDEALIYASERLAALAGRAAPSEAA